MTTSARKEPAARYDGIGDMVQIAKMKSREVSVLRERKAKSGMKMIMTKFDNGFGEIEEGDYPVNYLWCPCDQDPQDPHIWFN
jgi:hypothetical protein